MLQWLQEIRPKQWGKNAFVLAAPLFSTQQVSWGRAILGCALFIAISGAVYILNDLMDIERDKQHPYKRGRPLASGAISRRQATLEGALLLALGLSGAFYLSVPFLGIMGAYLIINLLYSFKLKEVPIIDVVCIAAGFVLRALAGGVAVRVPVTFWFLFCIFGLSLFLALRKREDDPNPRYKRDWLFWASEISRGVTGVGYTVFAIQSVLCPTVPLVWLGLFRYTGGQAEEALLRDKALGGAVLVFVGLVILIRHRWVL